MKPQKVALIVLAKPPCSKTAKTRIAQELGVAEAQKINRFLFEKCISEVAKTPFSVYLFWDITPKENYLLPQNVYVFEQNGANLGKRMEHAFEKVFNIGFDAAILIGTDSPEITAGLLISATDFLNHFDGVIGPAIDGGFYLLGLKSGYIPDLSKITYGTMYVYSQTKELLINSGIFPAQLFSLHDIDHTNDWESYKKRVIDVRNLP